MPTCPGGGLLDAVAADVVEHADDFRAPADEDGNTSEAGEAGGGPWRPVALRGQPAARRQRGRRRGPVEADLPTVPNPVGASTTSRASACCSPASASSGRAAAPCQRRPICRSTRGAAAQPALRPGRRSSAPLRRGEIRIEAVAEQLGLISTVQLEPEPIPLKLKVVLVGTREICALLQAYDDEFDQLFPAWWPTWRRHAARRQRARARRHAALRHAMPASVRRRGGAGHLHRPRRAAEDSTRFEPLCDALPARRAARGRPPARRRGAAAIERDDVRAAIAARRERAGRVNGLADAVRRGVLLIDTSGERTSSQRPVGLRGRRRRFLAR